MIERVEPRLLDKIWIPTTFPRVDGIEGELINCAGCENSLGSQKVAEAIRDLPPEFYIQHHDAQDITLRSKLASLHEVDPEQIFITSGAMNGINYSFGMFVAQNTRVGLLRPDFPCFAWFANKQRGQTSWLTNTGFPFVTSIEQVERFVANEDIAFLITANPSATTGVRRVKEEVEELVRSSQDTIFVIDEADSIDTDSVAAKTREYDNLLVLRSFSKFYGLADFRIGYLISPEKYREHFRRAIFPSETPGVSVVAARAVLGDPEYLQATQDRVRRNKVLLEQACVGTPYQVVPGSECFASYIWGSEKVEDPAEFLLRHKIKIVGSEGFGLNKGGRINLASSENINRVAEIISNLSSRRAI